MSSAKEAVPVAPPDAVCIIRLSAIGDCCHTLPVVRTLQAAWPRTRITWIIGRTEHGLLEGAEGIEFITFDKSRPWASLLSIRRRLAGSASDPPAHACLDACQPRQPDGARGARIGFDRRARDYQWLFTNERIAPPRSSVMDGCSAS